MGKLKDKISRIKKMETAIDKAGYMSEYGLIDFAAMAKDRKWATLDGKILPYSKIELVHLIAILEIFEEGKFIQRQDQWQGLKEEYYSRLSLAGKVLYGCKRDNQST